MDIVQPQISMAVHLEAVIAPSGRWCAIDFENRDPAVLDEMKHSERRPGPHSSCSVDGQAIEGVLRQPVCRPEDPERLLGHVVDVTEARRSPNPSARICDEHGKVQVRQALEPGGWYRRNETPSN